MEGPSFCSDRTRELKTSLSLQIFDNLLVGSNNLDGEPSFDAGTGLRSNDISEIRGSEPPRSPEHVIIVGSGAGYGPHAYEVPFPECTRTDKAV
jgi:hypothetical protein